MHLRKQFGPARWRKMKGVADIWLPNGTIRVAEIHWYEAHSIGKRKLKLRIQPVAATTFVCAATV